MQKILKHNKELLPLLGFVIGGVTTASSMFLYKLFTNPNIRINKEKRNKIIQE